MQYYRLNGTPGPSLLARRGSTLRNLTARKPGLDSFRALARAADATGQTVDDIASEHFSDAPDVDLERLESDVGLPVVAQEVWGAGVTYRISEEAREAESSMPEIYLDVYDADRPELFFKATPSRTVGPGEAIGVRTDSSSNAPEPELGVVLHRGRIVGYTIGNDVSSRDIEGQNPLYLPQAKMYDRCCALGPCVTTDTAIDDPHDLEMSLEMERDGEVVFEADTSTSEMARACEDLIDRLRQSNTLPEMTVLLTGTSIVPPEDTTLQPGDVVTIEIDGIGRLRNQTIEV